MVSLLILKASCWWNIYKNTKESSNLVLNLDSEQKTKFKFLYKKINPKTFYKKPGVFSIQDSDS